jgi:phenylacetic acid degradation operon negative regulatory protein
MNSHKSLRKLILLALEKSADGYYRFEDFAYNPEKYAFYGYPRPVKKSSLSQALYRLRTEGLIDFISNENIALKLTDKGKEQAVLVSLEEQEDDWDGIYRLVSFDIPEKRRVVRDLLRMKLKQWNFVGKQKSLWISKKNCTKALRKYIKQVGIENWVMVIETNDLGN